MLILALSDGETPYPGFELLCTVEAVLRGPFKAAAIQVGSMGKLYKSVKVNGNDYLTEEPRSLTNSSTYVWRLAILSSPPV
jgi:hypothetical protein